MSVASVRMGKLRCGAFDAICVGLCLLPCLFSAGCMSGLARITPIISPGDTLGIYLQGMEGATQQGAAQDDAATALIADDQWTFGAVWLRQRGPKQSGNRNKSVQILIRSRG